MRPLPLFLLAALTVASLSLAGCDSGDPDGGTVTITGTATNSFGRPLQGGTVTVEARAANAVPSTVPSANAQGGGQSACTAQTASDGSFQCDVPPGEYTVTITVPGYSSDSIPIVVSGDGTTTVNLPPLTGQGNIDGTLVDGVTGAILTFANVECSRQLADGSYGSFEFETETDASGTIFIENVFLGQAQCIVQAGASQIPVIITIEEDTGGTIAATPPPPAGSYRIVLSWGADPSDLDAHLTGPTSGGDRFHVYFANESYSEGGTTVAVLDQDDTSSFGPETITFTPTADGVYRYTVFNYTLRNSTEGGQSIHDSPTRVAVYDANGLRQTYLAPPPTSQNQGTVANGWRVVELTKQGSQITLGGVASTPPDMPQSGLQYVLANGSADISVFLTDRPLAEKDADR